MVEWGFSSVCRCSVCVPFFDLVSFEYSFPTVVLITYHHLALRFLGCSWCICIYLCMCVIYIYIYLNIYIYIFLCLIWYTYFDITWLIGSLTVYFQKCNPGPLQQLHDDWGPTRTWLEILELLSACGRVSAGGRRTLPRLAAVKQEIAGHLPLQMANGRRCVVSIISEGNGSWWSMIYQYISMIVVLLLLLVLLFLLSMRF